MLTGGTAWGVGAGLSPGRRVRFNQAASDLGLDNHVEQVGPPRIEGALQGLVEGLRLLDRLAQDAHAFGDLDEVEVGDVESGDGIADAQRVAESVEDVVAPVVHDDEEDVRAVAGGAPERLD